MDVIKPLALAAMLCFVNLTFAADNDIDASAAQSITDDFNTKVQQTLTDHYTQYKGREYFSGATLSVYIPNQPIKNFYIGKLGHHLSNSKVNADTLFQIGSITKSFTAVVLLQLEKDGKLNLSNTMDSYLPQYKKWANISLDQLLNMTSGLPNYSDAPLWNTDQYDDPDHAWTNEELIKYVYPQNQFIPPLKSKYFYTNTGYLLADLIVEKTSNGKFADILIEKAIKPANLTNTFYPVPAFDRSLTSRLAHGYSYNQYENPESLGEEVTNNLSWASAAGGLISTSEDIVKWVKAIFIDNTLLDTNQKQKLTQLVSMKTGKPIQNTTASDAGGFGLGLAQKYEKSLGNYWFYEGETLGFRAIYIYFPCNNVIISAVFNSATNSENDHSKNLVKKVYELILDQHYAKHC